jgi:hypothetical protein
MGGSSSRNKQRNTPIPTYTPAMNASAGITRPGAAGIGASPFNTGLGGTAPINRDQQMQLMQANQTIANLSNQLNAMRGGGLGGSQMPYGGYPVPGGGASPMPYGSSPVFGQNSPYGPPNPLLQNLAGQSPYFPQQQQQQPMLGNAVYRDTDFASVANIAGLNPGDVALLHREFMNLTRGGATKIDRVVFRSLLRDVLMEVNSENVDRAIESIFVTVDRNRDGFIDFPEFVGAFKDVLKGTVSDSSNLYGDQGYHDILGDQIRASGVSSGIASQPIGGYFQQHQPAPQFVSHGGLNIVPLASTGLIQQSPFAYGSAGNPPLLSLDQSQSSYVIATPGQYLITQPTALQCVPLPMM